jgi:hypothetical protein
MERRDITGKKYYKELSIKPVKQNMDHYCFIAIRTKLEPLEFFAGIFQRTNYLFQLSTSMLEMVVKTNYVSFRAFEFQDTLSDYVVHCLMNRSIHNEYYLLGNDEKNTCFVIPGKRRKHNNQLSLPFDDDDEETDTNKEKDDWDIFKTNMGKHSTNLAGKIDYLFPVEIRTYEILQPLFLYLPKMTFLSYMLINAKDIMGIDTFFHQWNAYLDGYECP